MADRVPDHASHVIVERPIENLFTASLGLHDPGRFENPQVMADQRRREPGALGNVSHP